MSTPIPDVQRQLDGLDPSSEEYRRLLLELLNHQDLKQHIYSLRGPDLQAFLKLLDNVSRRQAFKSDNTDSIRSVTRPHPILRRSFSKDPSQTAEYMQLL